MSENLRPTRLWWNADKGRGIARYDEVEVRLRGRPAVLLHAARVIEIEYLPGIVCYVQDATGPRRDMLTGEAAECLAYLRAMAVETRNNMEAWRG